MSSGYTTLFFYHNEKPIPNSKDVIFYKDNLNTPIIVTSCGTLSKNVLIMKTMFYNKEALFVFTVNNCR